MAGTKTTKCGLTVAKVTKQEFKPNETARFFVKEAVRKAFGHPDWPQGTEVVVYARKEDREKVLVKMSQMGYAISKFVEVDGLQAEIMGEGRFLAAKADVLRQPMPWEAPLSTDDRAWNDSMRNSVIYPPRELIEQMKRDYPKWLSQMFGFPGMSDNKAKE